MSRMNSIGGPLVAVVLLFGIGSICNQVRCQHVPPSEPYSSYSYDPYSYGYDVEDNYGNKQWRQERSSNPQEIHGSYGYRDKNGIYREVVYIADKHGFRANVKTNEPGVADTKSPADVKMDSYYAPQSVPVYPKHPIAVVPSYYQSSQV